MNFYEYLILTYPAKRFAWLMLTETLPENWIEELLDFISYSLQRMLLQLLHYMIPQLSVTDVMCLSYPLRRLFDVFLRKRRKFPWKTEVKALIFCWISYFSIEVYVSKVLFGLFERSIIEPLGWLIFMDFTLRQEKLFPILPLPAFVNVDELLIQPLCATVAEHHPLFVPHKERVISFLSIVLALLGGIAKVLRDAGD